MPVLMGRRDFLAAAMALPAALGAAAPASTRWALLSDTHISENSADTFREFQPGENLKLAVRQALAMHADGYVVNGDLARLMGMPGDYRRFAQLIAPLAEESPLALTLGNHDARDIAVAAFSRTAGARQVVANKWVSVVETGPVRLVLLDSLLETNKTPGLLGKAQRDWLAGYLASHTDRSTVIFVHHTLDDTDISMLDSGRFLDIVTPLRHVKAVFYGHSHAYHLDTREGLHLVNIPAVGYNFADTEPVGWVEAEMNASGARLTLHAFAGNRAADGETRALAWRG